jgi:hypothetical protein
MVFRRAVLRVEEALDEAIERLRVHVWFDRFARSWEPGER